MVYVVLKTDCVVVVVMNKIMCGLCGREKKLREEREKKLLASNTGDEDEKTP